MQTEELRGTDGSKEVPSALNTLLIDATGETERDVAMHHWRRGVARRLTAATGGRVRVRYFSGRDEEGGIATDPTKGHFLGVLNPEDCRIELDPNVDEPLSLRLSGWLQQLADVCSELADATMEAASTTTQRRVGETKGVVTAEADERPCVRWLVSADRKLCLVDDVADEELLALDGCDLLDVADAKVDLWSAYSRTCRTGTPQTVRIHDTIDGTPWDAQLRRGVGDTVALTLVGVETEGE